MPGTRQRVPESGGRPGARRPVRAIWDRALWRARPGAWSLLLPPSLRSAVIAIVASCAVITAVFGSWFAGQTTAGWPDRVIDARIQSAFAGHYALLSHIALIGNPVAVTGTAAVLCVLCLVSRMWRGAIFVVIAPAAAGAITEYVLKPLFDRELQGYLSMPSGHTAGAFSLAAVLAVLLAAPGRWKIPAVARVVAVVVAVVAASSVGVAMVGIGAHYATDTIAGAAVGTGTVLACALAVDLPGRNRLAAPGTSDDGPAGQ